MLRRKMLREMRRNFGQFFSLFVLALVALMVFTGLEGNVIGCTQARKAFHEQTALADLWLYGEGFSEENLRAVKGLADVGQAQLRMSGKGKAPDQKGAQIDFYLMRESVVNKPYLVEGEAFDPKSRDGLWLSWSFGNAWGLSVGDDFTFTCNGVDVTEEIKGLILSPEYEFMCADADADTVFEDIGYVFMNYEAFPAHRLLEQWIKDGTITAEALGDVELPEEVLLQLEAAGLQPEELSADQLLQLVEGMTEDQVLDLMPYNELILTTNDDAEALSHEEELADAIDNNYAVMVDATSIAGIERVSAELQQHKGFAYVFAAVFLVIALLVIVTTMNRMVMQQRTQIGTMNAIGIKRGRIMGHYMGYSFSLSVLGGIAGLLIGGLGFSRMMVDIFAEWYMIPGQHPGFDYSFGVVFLLVVGACTLSAFFSCRKLLGVKPAEALRPAPPKQGRRTVFERLPMWGRLGFHARYNLRDISRAKLRAFMGIFGTAVGMLLMTWSISAKTMVMDFMDWSFEAIDHFQYELLLDEGVPEEEADRMSGELDGELVMMASIEVGKHAHATSEEKSRQTLTVVEGKGLYNITDVDTKVTELRAGTVGITRYLADRMGVEVGDKVYWHLYTENDWHESEIGVITRSPQSSGLSMLREDYAKTGEKYTPGMLVTDRDVDGYENERVTGAYSVGELRRTMDENYSVMNLLIVFLILFSVMMVVIVLYNSGNLSFNERMKEFATLKVMGFETGRIRRLITVQNFWLSVVGSVLGLPFVHPLLVLMIRTNGDDVDFPVYIRLWAVLLSAVFVLGTSMLVSFLFSKRIRRLDMVEVLKGME